MLTLITCSAVFVTDLGMINAVGGGTIAVMMCFVFPAIMFFKAVEDTIGATAGQVLEGKITMALMVLGTVLGFVGVWQEIASSIV
jgi:uncharacterized membrane protein YiaA